jgi:hypothetical protein
MSCTLGAAKGLSAFSVREGGMAFRKQRAAEAVEGPCALQWESHSEADPRNKGIALK